MRAPAIPRANHWGTQAPLLEAAMGADVNKENVKTGQQGTNKPWERPGQISQNPDAKAPKKEDRERTQTNNETS